MRSDVLFGKKCVHIKLDKETHFSLRAQLFKHDITMQDLFEECARLVATESSKGRSIVESIVKRKIKAAIAGPEPKRNKVTIMGDLDADTLYNLINDESEKGV